MEDIKIRNAIISNIEQIMKIEHESFYETVCEDRSVFLDRILTFPDGFLVLEIDGQVSGYISSEIWNYLEEIQENFFDLNHSIGKLHVVTGTELYISSIGILKKHRGKGYGKLLFSELSRRIIEKYNILNMILIVSVQWTVAKKIYEKNGFEEVRRIDRFFDDGTNSDAIVMRKFI
ncbi:MAG: N-acetyltransferase [Methanomethylovorans sp.]|uniref:GNAT family N-acetyltransferase n=1 Tax=Methanomethylovorans sp. TaxID=2758717 RepID=UPI003C7838DA